ncbi:MAG: FG-GAP-like repeat-containing protein, partial [Deltaproteobacteria bacterium]|nr:FG-GAP-like repeat-containing protein [Deltaproteobacteria bacterium]
MQRQTWSTTLLAVATLVTATARASHGDEAAAPAEGMRTTSQVAGADEVSGGFRTSVPFALPAFHGIGPRLAVAYSSRGGVELAGSGWRLVGASSIERHSPGGGTPHFDDRDRYYLDGEELLRCADARSAVRECASEAAVAGMTMFTTRSGAGIRIGLAGDGDDATTAWHVWSPSGIHTIFGVAHTTQRGHAYRWQQTRVEDPSGNAVSYDYYVTGPDDEGALAQIAYGPTRVLLGYSAQPAPRPRAVGDGTLVQQRRQLDWVDVQVDGVRQRAYLLSYRTSHTTGASLLTSVQEFGSDAVMSTSGPAFSGSALPPTTFTYDNDTFLAGTPERVLPTRPLPVLVDVPTGPTITASSPITLLPGQHARYVTADLNGDLRADRVLIIEGPDGLSLQPRITQLDGSDVAQEGQTIPAYLLRPPAAGYRVATGDFDGDGTPDLAVVGLAAHRDDGLDNVATALARYDGARFAITYDFDGFGLGVDDAQNGNSAELVTAGDFNGDGFSDLALSGLHEDRAHIALGDGLGHFLGGGTRKLREVGDVSQWGFESDADDVLDITANGSSLVSAVVHREYRTGYSPYVNADERFLYSAFLETAVDQNLIDFRKIGGRYDNAAPTVNDGHGSIWPTLSPTKVQLATRQSRGRTIIETILYTTYWGWPVASTLHGNEHFWGVSPGQLHFADLDGDGDDEAYGFIDRCYEATASEAAHTTHWLVWSSFDRKTDQPLPGQSLQLQPSMGCTGNGVEDFSLADFDGDGRAEVVATVRVGPPPLTWQDGRVAYTMQNAIYHLPAAPGSLGRWLQMDLDGDSRREWVRLSTEPSGLRIEGFLRYSDGGLSVAEPAHIPFYGATPPLEAFRVADVDGDGRDDLALVAMTGGQMAFVEMHLGPDQQWRIVTHTADAEDPQAANQARWNLMDTDGDGVSEWAFVASHANGTPSPECPFPQLVRPWVYRASSGGSSDMTMSLGATVSTCDVFPQSTSWRVADLDGDGADDLVGAWPVVRSSHGPQTKVEALLSRRDDSFASVSSIVEGSTMPPSAWRVTDLNGDGARDLLAFGPEIPDLGAPAGLDARFGLARGFDLSRDSLVQDVTLPSVAVVALLSAGDGTMRMSIHRDVANLDGFRMGEWKLADVNGDHSPDLVRVEGLDAEAVAYPAAFERECRQVKSPVPYCSPDDPRHDHSLCRDLWQPATTVGARFKATRDFCDSVAAPRVSQTRITVRPMTWGVSGLDLATFRESWIADPDAALAAVGAQLGDIDADLQPELSSIQITNGVPVEYRTLLARPDETLTRTTSPLGTTTQVRYKPSSAYDFATQHFLGCRFAPSPSWVVDRVIADAGGGGVSETTYDRFCPMWSDAERRVLGWQETVESSQEARGADGVVRPATRTETLNQVDAACGARATHAMTMTATDGSRHTETTYAPTGEAPYFCAPTRTQTTETDATGGQRTLQQRFEYDAARDLVVVHDDGLVSDGADDQATVMTTIHAPGPFLTRTAQTSVHAGAPTGPVFAQTRTCYDAPVGCGAAGLWRGLPVRREAWDDHTGAWVGTVTTYDGVGNPIATSDALGRTSRIEYDPAWGLYPVRVTNPRGDSVRMDHDDTRVAGAVTTSFDEANGVLLTEQHYDVFGQPAWSYAPDRGTTWTTTNALGVPGEQSVTTTQMPGRVTSPPDFAYERLWSRRYLDGAGRVVREERPGDSGLATRVTEYADAGGPAYRVSNWTDGYTQPLWIQTIGFDAWGRPTTTRRADGARATTTYAVDQ